MDELIYLDNAASTPVDPRVVTAMLPYFTRHYGNPSAIHPMGRRADEALETAREQVAALINCQPEEVIFTSGGTESDNLAISGAAMAGRGRHIITSEIEHHAVLLACHALEKKGFEVTYLPVDSFGQVSPKDVEAAITPQTALVSIMAANNVIGTLQPVAEIGAVCRRQGVIFHTDAVQMAGHLPLDVKRDNIDLLSLSAHKFNGPKGVGILYAKGDVPLAPLILGGGQESGLRSGTENVPGIAGLGLAAGIAALEMQEEAGRVSSLRKKLAEAILGSIPGSRLNGHPQKRLPGNLNISFEGVEGEYLSKELAKQGICVSTGSACSSASHEAPYVLLATGLERDLANCSIRLSLGKMTTPEHIQKTADTLSAVVSQIRRQTPVW
ncbi:MAG: cysteine desulfurase family protein [Dehalococcoides mccartyi]|jgi:Cysteine sulfinate desulfinase/cysteine desulfurase and related enzymes|uniref:cysteine desulfurase n=1 Tax=bioreactor metagenome TaxID=1076179 RepID=A0A644UEM2_9ZZZZ|nr:MULTISPECIES: cysteine desulfurase family protein [Dehalococcoides]AII58996.1 cysteine desulfurase [Dehalococcoides mccartyi CG4]AQU02698.1 cysteine desulfurase NifS [Dehalococcoides mccartyi]AQU04033.1 cysteine desulfurase NifS [Dehalococcoides mccartyi]MBF4482115.1 cysteine desulfurase [Dehalococcoides mccartyi]MBJ7531119.1 cysteine desulfurase [Dehalococcoides mccartyi]